MPRIFALGKCQNCSDSTFCSSSYEGQGRDQAHLACSLAIYEVGVHL